MTRAQMNQTAQIILNNIVAAQRRQEILAGEVYPCSPWEGLVGECGKCQSCLDAARQRAQDRRKIWNSKGALCKYSVVEAFEVDWAYNWSASKAFRSPKGEIVIEMIEAQGKSANRYIRFFSPSSEDYEVYVIFKNIYYGSEIVYCRLDCDNRKKFSLHERERYLKSQADIDNYIYPGIEVAS